MSLYSAHRTTSSNQINMRAMNSRLLNGVQGDLKDRDRVHQATLCSECVW